MLHFCCIPNFGTGVAFGKGLFVCCRAIDDVDVGAFAPAGTAVDAVEWRRTIEESEWTRLEWALWWYHELRMAQEESDRLWALAPQYPLVFGEITLQWFVPDRPR